MKVFEVVAQENMFLKGLGAVKSLASKALPKAAGVAPKADDAAIRAAQDARAMAIGQRAIGAIKPGQSVRLQTADAAKDSKFASLIQRDKGMHLHNYVDGKVLEIVPATRAGFPDMMKVKLDTGQVVNWPVDRFMNTLR